MKLQVAIDRVNIEEAQAIIGKIAPYTDIIEVGTSLTKEFGVRSLTSLVHAAAGTSILGDIKTCDEGKYEFDLGFNCGFDYLTVMGSASLGTLEACYRSSQENNGIMMIDLLECDMERISRIQHFSDAVYCLHTSIDSGTTVDPVKDVEQFQLSFPEIKHIAIAGGIKLNQLDALAHQGVEIAIMGSAITHAADITEACKAAQQASHRI